MNGAPCEGSGAPAGQIALSVVLPVFRTRAMLPELQRRLGVVLDALGRPWELVFVDDACPEGSAASLAALAAADPRVRAVSLPRNVGQQRAVLAGLAHARGHVVVTMDADLQDPPEAIPRLLALLDAGAAGAFAGRRGRYQSRGRLLTSRLFKRTMARLCGVPDDAGLFVAMRRPLVERVLAAAARGGRPHLVAMIGCSGLPLVSTPVERAARPSGRSAYTASRRLRSAADALTWALRRGRFAPSSARRGATP
jgi:glycosyltransferase involved in cell wall biosynthesis